MMITDELITELPFRDVAEIEPLQKNDSYNDIPYKMSTNNDFLIEIDPDHNTTPNGAKIMTHHWNSIKQCIVNIIYHFYIPTFVAQNTN